MKAPPLVSRLPKACVAHDLELLLTGRRAVHASAQRDAEVIFHCDTSYIFHFKFTWYNETGSLEFIA